MKTNDDSPFPKRLKEARKKKGLSQKQLGILSGMDEFSASARMNQYEKGVHAPDFKTVKALAKVLEVPTAFLFCEEDELALQLAEYRANASLP
ncbi:helix-turn-helix domain-containing protein [Pseudoalteromonas xiamenensis]|uniref:Helix-turn-helix transcriptional regulator n=1 Tax=Pseudoalteromonas xiamenensis TaxID=882626 RepID=A0A975DEN9_9GAMM|nr:helix-turn-helix transcriptional regulator [Pseudoalteromonas xiamenensis]QTH70438.1 helix-turn-helix transcriptional regulator [Pseudoalteromonas xiamenensis]